MTNHLSIPGKRGMMMENLSVIPKISINFVN